MTCIRTFSPVGPSSGPSFVPFGGSFPIDVANLPHDPLMPEFEDTVEIQSTGIFGNAYDDHDLETLNTPYADQSVGAEADFNNMEPSTVVSPIPTTRVHSIHPKAHIIGDPKSAVQTRGIKKKNSGKHAMISYIQKQRRTNHKDFQNCLFACFLSQHEPTKISQALDDESWVEAMQEELLQNKKDERGIVVRNKARLVEQGYKREEGINYDEVFAPVARVEAIRLFLSFASFMNFPVYQMDVKSDFLYGTIEEEISIQPKVSHLNAVKIIFRYLKGQPKLGLWYPKDSPLILEAFSEVTMQTVVANSTTEAEYIAASHCSGQVLWIQNQMLDYGFNFMQTKIHVDSAICVIKNHVYHSKTKHIEIKHHFIRDSYEKRLIEMVKIHTDHNVADLLAKAFDVGGEAVHKELGDRMERAATTASSLKAEQDSGNINRT
ncbi:putative ribonuclease H-like domain-containing protein [Tanacetum coccineum]